MLSVVILTYNEESTIKKCIQSAFLVADEVIVLDSKSTDKTVEIAKQENAKVVSIEWDGWVNARNFAKELISYENILFLDADEVLSSELANSILNEKNKGFPSLVYSFNRLNYVGTKAIKRGAWYPDIKIRLYNKPKVIWRGEKVHEWADAGQIKASLLKGNLLHYSYDNVAEIKSRTYKYAVLASDSLKHKPRVILFLKMLFSPLIRFLRDYFIKFGFRDGKEGLFIAYQTAKEVFWKNKIALQKKGSQ